MAGNAKISELEARKRALVTESELCREALKAEVVNLRSHTAGFFQKFDRFRSIAPWVMLAGPVAIPLVGRFFKRAPKKEVSHPSGVKGAMATGMLALNLYRKYAPVVRSVVEQFRARRRTARESRAHSHNE